MAVANFALLTFLGGRVAEHPYIGASQIASVFYFGYFLIIIPMLGLIEYIGTTILLEERMVVPKIPFRSPSKGLSLVKPGTGQIRRFSTGPKKPVADADKPDTETVGTFTAVYTKRPDSIRIGVRPLDNRLQESLITK